VKQESPLRCLIVRVADESGNGAPGSQADDGMQYLNPSVDGASPINNWLRINGVDATTMMNGGGSSQDKLEAVCAASRDRLSTEPENGHPDRVRTRLQSGVFGSIFGHK
jgi:hypothetical protein